MNFKNYEEVSLELNSKINCFVGNNGIGKTNILDAIYYLSLCKSFFPGTDQQNVRHNQEFFVIQGDYQRFDKSENIYCGVKVGQRKIFRRNGKEYDRLSEHVGLLPVVMISPADSSLILDGSEVRRKFIDGVLSQFDHEYLEHLLRYNRALVQRNQILKDSSLGNRLDPELLDILNDELIQHGNLIFEKRSMFINQLTPVFQNYYAFVSDGSEQVQLSYHSQLFDEPFAELLIKSIERDRKLQFTTTGIHKDDLALDLNHIPIKRIGSQGQQKTYLVALKLAQFDFIKMKSDVHPILLLDDIFDKFDENRVNKIIDLVASENFGQIFISDTSAERMGSILKKINGSYYLYHIKAEGLIKMIN
jgi:DNA replication and repair protein RecF